MRRRNFLRAGIGLGLVTMTTPALAAGSKSKNKGVASSAEAAKPLAAGKSLPNTKITTESGETVKLAKVLGGKPTAIVFYRGHWCPYCMKHLAGLKEISAELDALGVKLVAITPDKPEYITEAKKKTEMDIDIYSDSRLEVAKAMGVAFQLDAKTAKRYKKHLVESTGHDTGQLPVPAVFLTDKTGKITWVFSKPDYKVRLSNEELLAAAKKHNS